MSYYNRSGSVMTEFEVRREEKIDLGEKRIQRKMRIEFRGEKNSCFILSSMLYNTAVPPFIPDPDHNCSNNFLT